ncbi:MAG TPA: dimethylglycine dehydrogenase, partial [Aliiroseovarius sp.]|nr:dimethylglycine dehydrogenase [Aliiroseovarius sp.]
CVFTFGIAQGGGAGKVLAEWIIDGAPQWDMWSCDPRRFTDYTDDAWCLAKAREVYGHEYDMHFPHHEWPAGRPKKTSPVHDKVAALGAQFGAWNGWERATWFARPGDNTSEAATRTWDRDGPWEARIRDECLAVRDGVGVLDLPGFSRYTLTGEGAADWLDGLIAGNLPRVGRMGLGYFPDRRGRVLTEMSIIRHDDDQFSLITAAAAQWHDREVLRDALPLDGKLELYDDTLGTDCLIVTGPASRALFERIAEADLTLPWLSRQVAQVAGKHVLLLRVSFAGELGWEIHADNADMPAIYDAVLGAGATPFGMYALDRLRLEKGYRAWKQDLSTDYTLLEAGLHRFIRLNKPADFPGKAALQEEFRRGSGKSFVTLIVDAGGADAPYMSTLWHGGRIVGETTSGGWGYRVGASIALGMVRADLAVPGTELEVEIYGERRPAVVQKDEPLWDPGNERLRA